MLAGSFLDYAGRIYYLSCMSDALTQHFADHGIIHTMCADAKAALFGHYAAVFGDKGVDIPDVWPENEGELLKNIKRVLMNLSGSDRDAMELGERLDDISKVNQYANEVTNELDRLEEQYKDGLEVLAISRESDLSRIVALCLCPAAKADVTLLVTRLSVRDTKKYRDYPWVSHRRSSHSEAEVDASGDFKPLDASGIAAGVVHAQESLSDEFTRHRRRTDSAQAITVTVTVYDETEDGQIWAIVEYGGSKQVVEVVSATGASGTQTFMPLVRDVVVLDCAHKVLHVHTASQWKEDVYCKVFTQMFMGREKVFSDGDMYQFTPIRLRGLSNAFVRAGWGDLRKVTVTSLETVNMYNWTRLYQTLRCNSGVLDGWEKLHEHYGDLVAISLELKVAGASRPLHVTIRENRGLSISQPKYGNRVRRWLRKLGFERRFEPEPFTPPDEDAQEADEDNALFWQQVRTVWNSCGISDSTMHRRFCPGVVAMLEPFMVELPELTHDSVWYSPTGRKWDVKEDNHDFFYYDADVESTYDPEHKVPEEQIVLKRLDRDEFVKYLSRHLLKADTKPKADEAHGLYDLGMFHRLGIHLFLYIGQQPHDQGFTPVCRNFRKRDGSIAFLSFSPEPPEAYKADVDADVFQFAPIWKFASYHACGLISPNMMENYFHRPTAEELGTEVRYWPHELPLSPSYHHISLRLSSTEMWVKYGDHEQAFPIERLPMFYNRQAGRLDHNGLWTSLARCIEFNNRHPEGFTLKELKDYVPNSSLNKLAKGLKDFFRLQELFYERIPSHVNRERGAKYKLAFHDARMSA